MNILHIDTSILGEGSVSRKLSAGIVARLGAGHTIQYRDLAAAPIPHLSGAALMAAAAGPEAAPEPLRADIEAGRAALTEFLAADTVVIGVPTYNFSIPSQLKAWLDRIMVAGVTFRYGADGRPEGLAGGKRVILAVARGGFYGPGTPTESYEHAVAYLRICFAFMGITTVEQVVAEGLAAGPEPRQAGLAQAEGAIAALAA